MTLVHARALLRIEPCIKIKPEIKEITTTIALFFLFIFRVKLIAMIKPRKMRYCYNCVTLILIKTVPLSVLVSNCFVPRENTLFSSLRIVCCFVLIISLALSYSPFLIVEYKNPVLHLLPRRRERCNDLCLECLCFPGSCRA